MSCNLRYVIYVNVILKYISWSWRTDTHGYIVKTIHPKPAYIFFEIFSKSSECFMATYWYIEFGTVK